MKKQAFTIIEIIVVISIIMILAGLITGGATVARRKALESKARADIAALELAIGMFETDVGSYPGDNNSTNSGNWNLVESLTNNSTQATNWYSNWHGPYIDFKSDDLENGEFIDPWGDPYEYDGPPGPPVPSNNERSYDLWSLHDPNKINNW